LFKIRVNSIPFRDFNEIINKTAGRYKKNAIFDGFSDADDSAISRKKSRKTALAYK
jgi:hypothetical protein